MYTKLSYIFVINLIVEYFNSCIIQCRVAPFSVVPNSIYSTISGLNCSLEIDLFP